MEGKGHGSSNEKGLANPSFYAWRIAESAVIRVFSISESGIKRLQARTFGKLELKSYKRSMSHFDSQIHANFFADLGRHLSV